MNNPQTKPTKIFIPASAEKMSAEPVNFWKLNERSFEWFSKKHYLDHKGTECLWNRFLKSASNTQRRQSARSALLSAFLSRSKKQKEASRSSPAIPQTQQWYKLNICVKPCLQMSCEWGDCGDKVTRGQQQGEGKSLWQGFKGAVGQIQPITLQD